jgi:outer membrane protein assembly factor BamB
MQGLKGRLLIASACGLLAGTAGGVAAAIAFAGDGQPARTAAAAGAVLAFGSGDCERVALPSRPNNLALVGSQIRVADGPTVELVDLEACSISGQPVRMPNDDTISAPPGHPGTVRGPDRAGGVVADGRRLWIVGDLTIYRADQTTRQITKRVSLGVLGITLRGRSLWTANLAEGPTYLYKLDADTGRVRLKRAADTEIVGMTAGRGRIWAISHDRGSLLRVNPSNGRFRRTSFRSDPHGIAFGAGYVWVAMYHQSRILRMDPRTGRVVGKPIRAGFPTEPMAAAGNYLWAIPATGGFLADSRRHEVLKIDARSGRILETFRAKGQPRAIVAVDRQAWVATTEPDELVLFGG